MSPLCHTICSAPTSLNAGMMTCILCMADRSSFSLKYEVCRSFGVKHDGMTDCLLFNVSSFPPGWHPSICTSQAEANFVSVLLPAASKGFFVAFIFPFLFAWKSLPIAARVSLCGLLRTIAEVPLTCNALGRSCKCSRIYSWVPLLSHHVLLADNFMFINDRTIKQHYLLQQSSPLCE